jgi:hypothetical protein
MEDLTQGTADACVAEKISHTSYVFMENYGKTMATL